MCVFDMDHRILKLVQIGNAARGRGD
jgi:hypothetical protein